MRKWWQLPEGWLSLLLLLLLMTNLTGSIEQARWISSLRIALAILTPAAVVGVLVGFLLAWLRRIPRWLAHPLGILGGIAWTIQLSASLQSVRVPGTGQTVEYLSSTLQGWKELASELLIRSIFLGRTFFRGDVGEDVVLFVIILALVCWEVGFLASWFAFRSHWPWTSLALPGIVILLNLVYAPQVPTRYFIFFAFLGLVFLIHYLWRQQAQKWQQEGVRFPLELSRGVLWTGIGLSAVLVLGTALLPTTAGSQEAAGFWDNYLQPWREVRDTWERLFSEIGAGGEGRLGGYAPTFDLAGARITPEGIALEIKTNRNDYLRGITFDQYDGRGWTNTAENGPTWMLPTNQVLSPNVLKRVRVAHTIIPHLQGGNMIFALAEPMSMTLPAVVELGSPYEQSGFGDIVMLRSRTTLREGRPYRVISWISIADKTSLRRTDLVYPSWVVDRYLQLPNDLPPRIHDLANRIVAAKLQAPYPISATVIWDSQTAVEEIRLYTGEGEQTRLVLVIQRQDDQIIGVSPRSGLVRAGLVSPYDAADAIQEYLRTELSYQESISPPPEGRDAIDYFLFDSHSGYCDYFGSAMVLLLRTQGIAARLVRGYASGQYDRETGSYIVPVSSAHTWVEVYFPNYGWQRFEPTPAGYTSLPARPEKPPSTDLPPRTPGAEIDAGDEFDPEDRIEDVDAPGGPGLEPAGPVVELTRPIVLIPTLLVVLIAGFLVILLRRAGHGLRRLSRAAATYERMCRWASMVGLSPKGQSTPYEYAWHLAEALPEQRPSIALIATQYVRERFGRAHLRAPEVDAVREAWNTLRWPLWGYLWQRLRREKSPQVEEVME